MRCSQLDKVAARMSRLRTQAGIVTGRNTTPDEVEEKQRCERSFYEFIKQAWKVLEPTPFVPNWHVREMCRILEGVTHGEYQNVLINIPPGFAKSLIVSVMWPAWHWLHHPGERYLASSHSRDIANRDTDRCRDLIKSEWYQNNWGHVVSVPQGEDRQTQFRTSGKGQRRTTSVDSRGTGERGRIIIFDDPHDLLDTYRPARIAKSVDHWSNVLSSRGFGEDTVYVVVGQRVAYNDVSAHILRTMHRGGKKFETLILPMTYRRNWKLRLRGVPDVPLNNRDRRHRGSAPDGTLLFYRKFPHAVVEDMQIEMEQRAEAILEQNPQEGLGAAFQRADILTCKLIIDQGVQWYILEDPYGKNRAWREEAVWKLISVDFATSLSETADFTSIGVYAVTEDDDLLLIDHIHLRMPGPDIVPTVWEMVRMYKPHHVLMEKAGFQLSEIQRAHREGMPVIPMSPKGRDKFIRSLAAQTRVRRHKFFVSNDLPDRHEVIEQMVGFPDPNSHDDIVDQISYAAEALTEDLRAMSVAAREELSASNSYAAFAGPFGPGYSQF